MRRLMGLIAAIAVSAAAAPAPKISARVHVIKRTEPGEFETFVRIAYSREFTAYTVAGYCNGVLTERSTRQLDELSRAPELPVVWRNLPGCDYQVIAMLHGAGGAIVARTPVLPIKILCFPCDGEN